MLGAAGLVIVPFGALWLAAERLPRLASWRFAFAVLTLIITTVVWALTSIVAAIQSGVAPGFARVGRGAARKIWPVLTGLRDASEERTHALPIYLVFVPIAVALTNHAGGEWTRDLLPVRRSPPMAVPVGAGPSFGIPKPLFQTHVPPGVTAYRTHSVPSLTASGSSSTWPQMQSLHRLLSCSTGLRC